MTSHSEPLKRCPRCDTKKPLSAFKAGGGSLKLSCYCKPCRKDYQQAWRARKPVPKISSAAPVLTVAAMKLVEADKTKPEERSVFADHAPQHKPPTEVHGANFRSRQFPKHNLYGNSILDDEIPFLSFYRIGSRRRYL